jgi:hypothetical protein
VGSRRSDLGHAPDPGRPGIDYLDGAVGKRVAVFDAVQFAEAVERRGKPGRIKRAVRERHPQLITLADIAQITGAMKRRVASRDAIIATR